MIQLYLRMHVWNPKLSQSLREGIPGAYEFVRIGLIETANE